ncbi:MAG TPA: hypothetical protein VM328_05325, partial [Fimbriimonadaceae bacterium]|nr:hypothetical protein [Fimbriimonadaceae bacterium]
LDPVAPYGFVQAVHAAYTPFRAAETGLGIVRAETTAYSMIVDGRGQILAEAGSGTEEILQAELRKPTRRTIYLLLGDWFLYLCGIVVLAGVLTGARGRVEPAADIDTPQPEDFTSEPPQAEPTLRN